MNNKIVKKLTILFLIIAISGVFAFPRQAEARNPFKDIFRGIRRATSFIVKLPDKATRWMGPTLGPIASTILTQNLSRHAELGRIFRNAQRAQKIFDSIDEQKRLLGEVKGIYTTQAQDLDREIDKMQAVRDGFAERMINDPDYGFQDYKDDVIALDRIIENYRQTAENLRNTANRLNTGDLIKMLGRDAIKDFLRGSEAIVTSEIRNQLERFMNPDIIKTFIDSDRGGSALDLILSGEINRVLGAGDLRGIDKDALIESIKDQIKNLAQSQREDLKNNWRTKIEELIRQQVENARDNLPAVPEAAESPEEETAAPADLGPIPTDEHGCRPGYIWKPQTGVGCVQEDCPQVANAHWSYEGYCVCGSSGSMNENPDDPNMECAYPAQYRSCPGCIYACVHLGEDCPELPDDRAP